MLLKVHPIRDPALRKITQRFGENPQWYARFAYDGVPLKGHNGIDFGVPIGTTIQAVADGTTLENSYDPQGFGYYVKLMHAWGHSLYGHLSQPGAGKLVPGQPVHAGNV